MKEKFEETLSSLKAIKDNVSKFVEENPVKDLQASVKNMVTNAKDDLQNIATKDINLLKKKFLAEKKQVNDLINKKIPGQIKQAKKFIEDQKKEISRLQKKLETIVPAKKKKTVTKKAAPKKAVAKKVVKKVAKK